MLFLSKKENKEFKYLKLALKDDFVNLDKKENFEIMPSSKLKSNVWCFHTLAASKVVEKLNLVQTKLVDITKKIFKGSSTGNDKIYLLRLIKEKDKTCVVFSEQVDKEIELEKNILKPFLLGLTLKNMADLKQK